MTVNAPGDALDSSDLVPADSEPVRMIEPGGALEVVVVPPLTPESYQILMPHFALNICQ